MCSEVLFEEDPAKSRLVWSRLVSQQRKYSFPLDRESVPQRRPTSVPAAAVTTAEAGVRAARARPPVSPHPLQLPNWPEDCGLCLPYQSGNGYDPCWVGTDRDVAVLSRHFIHPFLEVTILNVRYMFLFVCA